LGLCVKPILHLVRQSFGERPELGPAVSRVLLRQVAAGERPELVRIGRPGRVVQFGRRDVVSHGYGAAVGTARKAGYEAVERLAGGRAALYNEGTLSISRAHRDPDPARRTRARFEEVAGLLRSALDELGVDSRIGEVPGEYCPGEFSVNARGAVKLAGLGQRLVSGGAHVGGVLVVDGSAEVRRVLEPVYEAMEIEWAPETTGAVSNEVPGTGLDEAEAAIVAAFEEHFTLVEAELDAETLRAAESLAAEHLSPPPG
jgi:octanoyl-[GcvH]:protein N-octanoyltransferase